MFLGQIDESNICQVPLKLLYYFKGKGGVIKVGVIVNQMVIEASAISLGNK